MLWQWSTGLINDNLSRSIFYKQGLWQQSESTTILIAVFAFVWVRKSCQYNQAKMNVPLKQASLHTIITADTWWKAATGENDRSKTLVSHRGVDACATSSQSAIQLSPTRLLWCKLLILHRFKPNDIQHSGSNRWRKPQLGLLAINPVRVRVTKSGDEDMRDVSLTADWYQTDLAVMDTVEPFT